MKTKLLYLLAGFVFGAVCIGAAMLDTTYQAIKERDTVQKHLDNNSTALYMSKLRVTYLERHLFRQKSEQ